MIKFIFGVGFSISLLAAVIANTNVRSQSAMNIVDRKTNIDKLINPQILANSLPDLNVNNGNFLDSLSGLEIDRCGSYVASKNKAGIISEGGMNFNNAGDFSEGLARVSLRGKCGYINSNGKLLISARLDMSSDFSQELAAVKINRKWGFINRNGDIVITPKFERVSSFCDGLAIVQIKGKQGFIDRTGRVVVPLKFRSVSKFKNGLALVEFNNKYGYIDRAGNLIIAPQFDAADDFHEGVARIDAGSNGVYFIDRAGRRITRSGQFSVALEAQNSLIAVGKADHPNGRELWGFIDLSGKQIIPFKFYRVDSFQEGLAVVNFKGKHGYIDRTGKFIIPPRFYSAESFKDGLASVTLSNTNNDPEGAILANDENEPLRFGYINKTGKMIIPPTLSFGGDDGNHYFSENLRQVYIKDKWGFINKLGKLVIPAQFDNVGSFRDGIAKVEIDNKWAYINKLGIIVARQSSRP